MLFQFLKTKKLGREQCYAIMYFVFLLTHTIVQTTLIRKKVAQGTCFNCSSGNLRFNIFLSLLIKTKKNQNKQHQHHIKVLRNVHLQQQFKLEDFQLKSSELSYRTTVYKSAGEHQISLRTLTNIFLTHNEHFNYAIHLTKYCQLTKNETNTKSS